MRGKYKVKKCSLFVGRWQPFHEGHKALVETVLKKRKPIVMAIRDTADVINNPVKKVKRIADFLGIELTRKKIQKMNKFVYTKFEI